MQYTVTEAKNRLPELIRQAETGNPVTITKRGIPVVEIVRKQDAPRRKRIIGGLDAEMKFFRADWDRPQNDLDAWLRGQV